MTELSHVRKLVEANIKNAEYASPKTGEGQPFKYHEFADRPDVALVSFKLSKPITIPANAREELRNAVREAFEDRKFSVPKLGSGVQLSVSEGARNIGSSADAAPITVDEITVPVQTATVSGNIGYTETSYASTKVGQMNLQALTAQLARSK